MQILNVKEIDGLCAEWNGFVRLTSKSPFYLSEYVKAFINNQPDNCKPVIAVFWNRQKIVGIAVLSIMSTRVGKQIMFSHPFWCSDFLFDDKYRYECLKQTFDYLFKENNYKLAYFDLPSDSPNLEALMQLIKTQKMYCRTEQLMGQRVVSLDSSWDEFKRKNTKNFRKKMFRIERNLNHAGTWKTIRTDGTNGIDVDEEIAKIEMNSWKQKYWEDRGSWDRNLALFLKTGPLLTRTEPDFKWFVWFLILNGETIAYQLAHIYKETAYFLKTSYNMQYSDLSPGIFVVTTSIRELMEKRESTLVDLLTDYPYMQIWTKTCVPRMRVKLAKGRIPAILQYAIENPFVIRIYQFLSK